VWLMWLPCREFESRPCCYYHLKKIKVHFVYDEIGFWYTLKVGYSISDEDTDFFFNLPNPSSRTTALELDQALTEMNARKSFWG
jgi:hypothetical protein